MLSRLSYSNVIASVALFLAICGTSYAAITLPKNSVGPKQLQQNSVRSVEVKPGSLRKSDFKKSHLESMRGPQGTQGPQGPQGVPGEAGATNVVVRIGDFHLIPPDTTDDAQIACLPGEVATGGGIEVTNGSTADMRAISSRPVSSGSEPTGWYARAFNVDHDENDAGNISVRAYAICASP